MTNKKSSDHNVQIKGKSTGEVRANLANRLQLVADGKADHKETDPIIKEAKKINKELKEQLESDMR